MSKKHMKNNEVDLDEITPNLVPPKEVLDLLGDMIKHPENHREDFEKMHEENEVAQQAFVSNLKKMIDTGLSRKGCKLTDGELCAFKQDYERIIKVGM